MPVTARTRLDRIVIGLHLGLIVVVCASLLAVQIALVPRILVTGLVVVPLLVTLPRLLRSDRGVIPWLSLAMVAYAGLGSVEVVASRSIAASLTMLFALLELALALSLRRRQQNPAAAATRAP